jgi:hypothetical protein
MLIVTRPVTFVDPWRSKSLEAHTHGSSPWPQTVQSMTNNDLDRSK